MARILEIAREATLWGFHSLSERGDQLALSASFALNRG